MIAGVPSNPEANQLFIVLLARILCFNTAPALECFLPNISITVCFPIRRALLRLAPRSALPALQRKCQLRSSAFPNQTDNLSLRCFSRKSKNHCILFPDWCLHCYMVGGDRWCAFKSRSQPVIHSASCPHIMPSCAFQHCTSTWVLFAKYFKHSMLPHPQSVAKTGTSWRIACLAQRAPAEKLSLSQPNRQSKLEMFQQEVEEQLHSFSSQASAFIVTSWWEVIAGVPSNPEANQ